MRPFHRIKICLKKNPHEVKLCGDVPLFLGSFGLWRASGVTGRAVAILIPQKHLDSPFFQPSSAFRTVLRQGFTDFHSRFLSVDAAGILADFSKFDGLAPAALRAADIINFRLGSPAQPPRQVDKSLQHLSPRLCKIMASSAILFSVHLCVSAPDRSFSNYGPSAP